MHDYILLAGSGTCGNAEAQSVTWVSDESKKGFQKF